MEAKSRLAASSRASSIIFASVPPCLRGESFLTLPLATFSPFHAIMSDATPIVLSVNLSPGGIPKTPVAAAHVDAGGLRGDGHDHDKHNTPMQAISILDIEDYDDLKREGYDVFPGATGENITCRALSVDDLAAGDRLRFSGGVVLELTKKRKPCFVLDAIDPTLKDTIVGRCGYLAKVITPGMLRPGETIEVEKAKLKVDS